MSNFKARKWQQSAFKVVDRCTLSKENEIIPVNACVGSGKTSVACYAFGDFIMQNQKKHTVQMFVTPRIRLCDQQTNEITDFLEDYYGLNESVDYSIIQVDCTKNMYNRKSTELDSKHTIFVVCAESLWGEEKKSLDKNKRWHGWVNKFKTWSKGYGFGYAVFDEAHNYESKQENLFGGRKNQSCINDFFNVMLLSGTPASFQSELSKEHKKNVCSCSPALAMESKWICKPCLNLVKGDYKTQLPGAIKAVLNREIELCKSEIFNPRIMINCSSIDDVIALINENWFKVNTGKKFHFISLHSSRNTESDSGQIESYEPTIDGKKVKADEAFKAIESIDNNSYFKDDLPILVAQIAMLSEGINVKSFNAIITSTNSDRTAMQQIGRGIRNYSINSVSKVTSGHANIYVLTDNVLSIMSLLQNLEKYELTEDCYDWGKKIDISTGSGVEPDEDGIPKSKNSDWEEIDPNNDLEIIELMGKLKTKSYKTTMESMYREWCNGDTNVTGVSVIDELENLLEDLKKEGLLKLWSDKPFSKAESRKARKAFARAEKLERAGKKAEAKAEKKSVKCIPSFEICMKWVFIINHMLDNETNRRLWNLDTRMALTYFLGDSRVAEFLSDHMNDKMLARIQK